ncbi:MAG: T9SS type A sorting domain-containing protein [Bacteroidetes bacterium]|nr:T9SS type A sorting domain-containing protein [Bacteroidota bacterium]
MGTVMVRTILYIFIFIFPGLYSPGAFSQGSWNPPGADLSYPRTLLDTNSIEEIRGTLSAPLITDLYHSIWNTANLAIPAGDSTDGDRFTRALMAREAAFVVLMDRKWENGNIVNLLPAERDSLVSKTQFLLNTMNTKVGYQSGWVFYQEWQHRSKELIFYLTAYDLLKGVGLQEPTSRDSLIHFTGNLYSRAMATYTIYYIQFKFFDFQFDNHSIMTASALGLAAVVLNDHEDANPNYQPQNWINAGLWNLDNTLWIENGAYPRVSEPDTLAGYAEGPGYFNYAFQNAFPFIRSLYNFLADDSISVTFNTQARMIRNPWYDERYYRIYDWMNKIMMPDGSEPAIHDSPIGFGTHLMALSGKSEFNLPNPGFSYDDPFVRTQYIATNVAQGVRTDSLFQALPAAGSLVFRSSWDKDAVFMHFIGKHGIALTGAKSHHQGDASSFSMMAYGRLFAVDPGYPGAPESNFVNKATNHNCILVNGGGPQPPIGEFVNTASNTAFIEDYFHIPNLTYGEVRTSYWGDSIIRCNLFIRNRYFILNDLCSAPAKRDYSFQFHGNGLYGSNPASVEGAFIPGFGNFRGIYKRDTVSLLVQVLSDVNSPSFSFETDSLATGSSSYRRYSKMLVHPDSAANACFQTVMFPYTSDSAVCIPLPGISGASASVLNYHSCKDFILTQSGNSNQTVSAAQSGLSEAISCNGQINYIGADASNHVTSVLIRGEGQIKYGNQVVLSASHPILAAWSEVQLGIIEGYSGDSGKVSVYSSIALRAVLGNISSVTYDISLKLNIIEFTGKGRFRLEPSNGISPLPQNEPVTITACPNPSSNGIFTIILNSGNMKSAVINITDQSGKLVQSRDLAINPGETSFQCNLSGLPAGVYILNLSDTNKKTSINLIKSR